MTDTDRARHRAFQHQYEGGVIEIGQYAVYILLGILMLIVDAIKTPAQNKWFLALGVILFSVAGAFALSMFIKYLRMRLIAPRTGRVSFRPDKNEERRNAVLMVGTALVIAAVAIFTDGWYSSPTAVVGAGISLTLMFTALRTGFLRMKIVAALPLLISLVFAYFNFDVTQASAVSIGGTGVVGLILGLIALRKYLRANPLPEGAAEGLEKS